MRHSLSMLFENLLDIKDDVQKERFSNLNASDAIAENATKKTQTPTNKNSSQVSEKELGFKVV